MYAFFRADFESWYDMYISAFRCFAEGIYRPGVVVIGNRKDGDTEFSGFGHHFSGVRQLIAYTCFAAELSFIAVRVHL